MSKPKGVAWPNTMLKAVEKMLEAFPSEQEVQESVDAINSLIGSLERLKMIISAQPSQNLRQDVLRATTVLSAFLSSYTAKALLVEKHKPLKPSITTQSDTVQLFKELDSLPLEEIQRRLLDKKLYSVKDLKSLATHLEIGVDKNFRREDIADTIFKRGFANPRGYQALGGEASRRLEAKAHEGVAKPSGEDG